MVDAEKDKTKGEEIQEEIQRIRMTLRSKEIKALEAACAEIVARAKNQGYETKGPVRIPTKILKITTRKSPCGEGSKTWDRFEMRIHKRVVDIHCPSSVVKEITNFRIDPGVDVNLINKMKQSNHPNSNIPSSRGPPGSTMMQPGKSQNNASANISDLLRILPQIDEVDRQQTRESILEIIAKDMNADSIQSLIQSSGSLEEEANITENIENVRGQYSNSDKVSPIKVVLHLECQINQKYPASTSNANYKGLSKRIIQSLKSKEDQRQLLVSINDLAQVDEFMQQFIFDRLKPGVGAAQVQESAGSAATIQNSSSVQQNNPFSFPRPGQGGPPSRGRGGAGPQSRLPMQRFAAPSMFVPPTMEYTPGAINPSEKMEVISDGAAGSTQIVMSENLNLNENNGPGNQTSSLDSQNQLEQERPSFQFNNPNQIQEEHKFLQAVVSTVNVQSDSGAADTTFQNVTNNIFDDLSLNQHPQQNIANNQADQTLNNNQFRYTQDLNVSQNQISSSIDELSIQEKQSSNNLPNLQSEEQADQSNYEMQAQQQQENQLIKADSTQDQYQQFIQNYPLQEEQSVQQTHDVEDSSQLQIDDQRQNQEYSQSNNQTLQQHNSSAINANVFDYGNQQVQIQNNLLETLEQEQVSNQNQSIQEGSQRMVEEEPQLFALDNYIEANQSQQIFEDERSNIDLNLNNQNEIEERSLFNNNNNQNIVEPQFEASLNINQNLQENQLHDQNAQNSSPVEVQMQYSDYEIVQKSDNIEEGNQQNLFRNENIDNQLNIDNDYHNQIKDIQDINKELESKQYNQSVLHDAYPPLDSNYRTEPDLQHFDNQKKKDLSSARNQSLPNFGSDSKPPKPVQYQSQIHSIYNAPQNDFGQLRSTTPSMNNLMQFQTSRPPQSVASINITNYEDSEALMRAFKKKKNEVEELKENFYRVETEFFTERQKALLLEEENNQIKQSLLKTEKNLRELQMRESRKDSDLIQKQLQLKTQEAQAYQNELSNQKNENLKLREKLKEAMSRQRTQNSGSQLSSHSQSYTQSSQDNSHLNEMIQQLQKEKFEMQSQLQNKTQNFEQKYHELQQYQIQAEREKNFLQSQLNNNTSISQSSNHKIQELSSQNEYFQSQHILIQEQLQKANNQIQALQQELSVSQNLVSELRSENKNLQNEKSSLTQQLLTQQKQDSLQNQKQPQFRQQVVDQRPTHTHQVIKHEQFGDQSSQIDEDKKSSAPPSQVIHQDTPNRISQLSSSSNKEAEDFFANLSNKPVQQQQFQAPAKQNPQQHNRPQQQTQNINTSLPQTQIRPPSQQLPQQKQQQAYQSAYNFTLDDISFEDSFSQNNTSQLPSQQQQQKPQVYQQQSATNSKPQPLRYTAPTNQQPQQQQQYNFNAVDNKQQQNQEMLKSFNQQQEFDTFPQQNLRQKQKPVQQMDMNNRPPQQQTQAPAQRQQPVQQKTNTNAPQSQNFQVQNKPIKQQQHLPLQKQPQQQVNQMNKYVLDDDDDGGNTFNANMYQSSSANANVIPNSLFD
eukprot:403332462